MALEFTDPVFGPPDPDPVPPEGGWREPCRIEDHRWGIELEGGRFAVVCLDPCDEALFDPSAPKGTPGCLCDWTPEDYFTPDPIPVVVTYVDDSTPAGPWGGPEYGYYIEVQPTVPSTPKQGSDG